MSKIRQMTPEQLASTNFHFQDRRLPEMLYRYRARNFPCSLNSEELANWQAFCQGRLTGQTVGAGITFQDYFDKLAQLQNDASINQHIVAELQSFGQSKLLQLGLA